MDWFKKHVDAVIVLTGLLSAVFWMNGRFNEVDNRFNNLEKDITIIKTVLVMKNIMPVELEEAIEAIDDRMESGK